MVHSDVCGPIEFRGLNGERYILLFVDVYSRFCKIFLLKERKEFIKYFEIYRAAVERRHGRPIKTFISDGGGEYTSTYFKQLCDQYGIMKRVTTAHTPEQNGIAEIRFKTMFNKVRAMLIGSGLPKQLWPEAVLHHIDVQNMMVNSTTKETPYWRWFGVLPDISGL